MAGVWGSVWFDYTPYTRSACLEPSSQAGLTTLLGPSSYSYAPMHGWLRAYFTGAPEYVMFNYKIADSTKTRSYDVFKMIIVMSILALITGVVVMVWCSSHVGGFEHTNWGGGGIGNPEGTLNTGFQAVDYDHITHWTYMVTGAVFAIILYALRARFIWMGFLNPVALAQCMWLVEWTFPRVIPALIIKYVVVKIGGVRALEEKAMPAITGWLVGWGSMFIIVAIRSMFVESLPNFWSLYVP